MIGNLVSRITEYFKLKILQIKLEMVGHLARLMSHILVMMFLTILALFMILFLSFAAGAFLNELLESNYAGYLLVAAGYFVVLLTIGILAKTGRIQAWLEAAILRESERIEENE